MIPLYNKNMMIRSNNVIIKNRVEKLRAWGKNKNFNIKNE